MLESLSGGRRRKIQEDGIVMEVKILFKCSRRSWRETKLNYVVSDLVQQYFLPSWKWKNRCSEPYIMNVVRFSDHIVCAFAAVLLADCSLLIMYCFWFGVKWFRTKHADLQCAKCCLWYHNFCWHSLAVGNCCDNFFIIVLLKSSIMKTYWENISAVCCRYVIIIILIYKYCHLCGTYRKMLYCYYYAVVTGEPIEV